MTNALGKAPSIQEYTEALQDLRPILEREATGRPARWARRRLLNRDGIVVSLRTSRVHAGRFQLAIARDAAPTSLTEQSRWESEVRLIQLAFVAETWERGADVFSGESVAAVFDSHRRPAV